MIPEQQHQINLGYEQNIDPTPYADPSYSPEQMYQYHIALVEGLDITSILNPKFNPEQLFQLREGLAFEKRAGVPVGTEISLYNNPRFSASQMYEIRMGIAYGIDVTYADPRVPLKDMRAIRKKAIEDMEDKWEAL
jgi:hypothetical protein